MSAMYKLTNVSSIQRTTDSAFIPPDPANTDYQAYLKWLEEGNTPDPADPIAEPVVTTPTIKELQKQLAEISAQLAALSKK